MLLAKDESRRFAPMSGEEDGRNYEFEEETERCTRDAIMERVRNRRHAAQVGVIEAEMPRLGALVTGTWDK